MKGFEPTLLDKLFDDDPKGVAEGALRRFNLEDLKASIALDLESLLNTRVVVNQAVMDLLEECERSLATYGVADFSGLSLASFSDRTYICESLRRAIQNHESRLSDVAVSLEIDVHAINLLRFVVSAKINAYGLDEPVGFDAMLQPTSLQYSVKYSRPKR